jgi:phosphoglycerate kinase
MTMKLHKMVDLNLTDKRVLIREDLNVPLQDGKIMSEARILAALPTIQHALQSNAKVMITSHLGRPTEGVYDAVLSLTPVAQRLSELLEQPVPLIKDWLNGFEIESGKAVLFENARFNVGEKNNDDELSKKIAALCDIYVNDAFATAHRKEATTYGVAKYAKKSCAGPLLIQEIEALEKIMENPKRPLVAIIGGSKISTKLKLLGSLIKKVDTLIPGGGIANTFLAASDYNIGRSLFEPDFIKEAKTILSTAKKLGIKIPLPQDVIVSTACIERAKSFKKLISELSDDEMILDIGPNAAEQYAKIIQQAKTILWNGPVGVFEFAQFTEGTKTIAQAIAKSSAYSVAGGGDTIAALERYALIDKMSYISTGGGAFLAYLEGEKLPAIAALEEAY